MSTVHDDSSNSNSNSADSLRKLSAAYMEGIMRLSELGFSTTRDTFEACSAASKTALSETKNGQPATSLPIMLGQSALDKSLEFSRGASEIIASTQQQLSRILLDQLSRINLAARMPASWSTMGELFAKGGKQFTNIAADNVRAAAEAGSDAVAKVTQQAKRAS